MAKQKEKQPTLEEFKLETTSNEVPVEKKRKTEKLKSKPVTSKISTFKNKKSFTSKEIAAEVGKKLAQMQGNFKLLPIYVLITILAILTGVQANKINVQKNNIIQLNNRVEELQNQTAQEIVNNRRIFVCNMEEIYKQLNVESKNTDFELEIAKLNDDVSAAQQKIKNLKDAKVKADFTDVYLNSLLAKRDKMVEEYQNSLHETMVKINQAMAAVAAEKKATTIFRSQAVTALTKYTIDVTNDILQKINEIK